jgi:hypothetical protein
MLDLLIASWQCERGRLVGDLDYYVVWATGHSRVQVARIVKRIAKLDCRISTAEVLRRRYLPAREPSSLEHASAIAALLAEGGNV